MSNYFLDTTLYLQQYVTIKRWKILLIGNNIRFEIYEGEVFVTLGTE